MRQALLAKASDYKLGYFQVNKQKKNYSNILELVKITAECLLFISGLVIIFIFCLII